MVFDVSFLKSEATGALARVTDSKMLSARDRKTFYDFLTRNAFLEWGVALVEPVEIDRINILQATKSAMTSALSKLTPPPDYALVDGRMIRGLPCKAEFIVKGDARSLSIAAASIIAKFTRDKVMDEIDAEYPQYGFIRNKGYGTREHLNALQRYGATPHHRKTFKPVREILDPPWDFA